MQPTVPASLLLGVHLQQPTAFLFLLSRGVFLTVSSPAFLPRPQSCVVAQFTVKPASLPGDFPVSLGWLQRTTR